MNVAAEVIRPVDYSYSKRGEQKQVRQHRRRGRRINIWGVQEPAVSFDYALMVSTLKTPTHLQLIEWQAQKAQQYFAEAGQLTVIVLDNATPHISRAVQQHFERWQPTCDCSYFSCHHTRRR